MGRKVGDGWNGWVKELRKWRGEFYLIELREGVK